MLILGVSCQSEVLPAIVQAVSIAMIYLDTVRRIGDKSVHPNLMVCAVVASRVARVLFQMGEPLESRHTIIVLVVHNGDFAFR